MTTSTATIAATPALNISMQAAQIGYKPSLTCSVSVRNLESAKDWYQTVLGFTHLYTMTEIGWSEVATTIPGVNIGLSQVEDLEIKGSIVLTFEVQDIAHARAQLEQQHVRFDGETQTIEGMVKLASFFDPDGNPYMLSQTVMPNQ